MMQKVESSTGSRKIEILYLFTSTYIIERMMMNDAGYAGGGRRVVRCVAGVDRCYVRM